MKTKYEEGYAAFNDGRSYHDNPYHVTTDAAEDWYDGWLQAQADDEAGTNES